MTRARRNRSSLPAAELERGARLKAEWNWFGSEDRDFRNSLKMIDIPDEDYPDGLLIECGRLARLHVRLPSGASSARPNRHPRRQRDTTITFSRPVARQSFASFDPDHPNQRLYFVVANPARKGLKERFWEENELPAKPLSEWANLAGGRHGTNDYPGVMAKPVGVMTAAVYFTEKKEDGPSFYIHRMGEMTHYYPILACDQRGRLWVCGGNYTAPSPGITD